MSTMPRTTKNKASNTNNKYVRELMKHKKAADSWKKKYENLVQKIKDKKDKQKSQDLPRLEKWRFENELSGLLQNIVRAARETYQAFPFGAKEGYFQDLLQEMLIDMNYRVQREVNVHHSCILNGKKYQLGNNHGGRVDLLLHRWRMVMELKATGKLTSTEHYQTLNYIEQKRVYDGWGDLAQGLLINFGDSNLEIWYMKYNNRVHKYERVLICNDKRIYPDTIDTTFLM